MMVSYLEPPAPPTRLTSPPVKGRVLVLAPHPDDETIGPGGALIQHAAAGDEIHVLFVTAGTSGDPTGAADPAEYAACREREARAAAEVLGVADRVGSLETGKDADFAVLTGAPLSGSAGVLATWVEGSLAWTMSAAARGDG